MFNNERRELEKRMQEEGRLPPGQSATLKFPVLHYGHTPRIDINKWTLQITGMVEQELTYTWDQLLALPSTELVCDIHCVTKWSKFDTQWEGVAFKTLYEQAKVKPDANFVIMHGQQGYTANLPLDVMLADDVLLAYKYAGKLLEADHGYPLRSLIPEKYFWKSTKWLVKIEFTQEDRLGFWERAGYNNEADPFKEQRYSNWTG